MAILTSLTVNDTGYIKLPSGTTAQRPGSPVAGMVRYNTDQSRLESYNGSTWEGFPLVRTTFNYNGADQTFTVPTGITKLYVKCWGGGGGGGGVSGWAGGGTAGGGGYSYGEIATSGGTQFTVVVGSRGYNASPSRTYGGGGQASNTWGPGSGGGQSGVYNSGAAFSGGSFNGSTGRALIIAGGGGGGGANRNPGSTRGGAGGGATGESGSANYGNNWGNGGTQNAGGTGDGGNGGSMSGSNCNVSYGAGGGGGWYGGGAGYYEEPQDMGGGGGGSGYINTGGVSNGFTTNGIGITPGGSEDPDRQGAGVGGLESGQGTDGKVIIYY
jgi:hypothetical protein